MFASPRRPANQGAQPRWLGPPGWVTSRPDQVNRVVRIRTVLTTRDGGHAAGYSLVDTRPPDDRDVRCVALVQKPHACNVAARERERAVAGPARVRAAPAN